MFGCLAHRICGLRLGCVIFPCLTNIETAYAFSVLPEVDMRHSKTFLDTRHPFDLAQMRHCLTSDHTVLDVQMLFTFAQC